MEGRGKDLEVLLGTKRKVPISTAVRAAPSPVRHAYDTDFESLPQYQAIRIQREMAAYVQLKVPYYRIHDVRAGAGTVIGGQTLINFASYDYLGLNGHPEIVAAAEAATREFGTSVSASRISAGERQVHRDFEQALAATYEAEDCVVFNSGHAAGISSIATLVGPKDLIVYDALIHNCISVGAQLSGAARRTFAHNDLEALESTLAADRHRFERVLVIVEGLYSMDGDGPDLPRLIEIKNRFGAWLMVDDAHGLGVLGKTGRGIFEHQAVDPRAVDIWFGTLSKTLVGCGGYIAGGAAMVDILKCLAPGFVYSVGMPASVAAASAKALEIMHREPARVARLQALSQLFLKRAAELGLNTDEAWGYGIIPVIVADSASTLRLSERLGERGVNAFPILPPGVPEKSSRLRFFINQTHSDADILQALDETAAILREIKPDALKR